MGEIITMHNAFPHLSIRFKGHFPAESVAQVRDDILEVLRDHAGHEGEHFEVFELISGQWTPLPLEHDHGNADATAVGLGARVKDRLQPGRKERGAAGTR